MPHRGLKCVCAKLLLLGRRKRSFARCATGAWTDAKIPCGEGSVSVDMGMEKVLRGKRGFTLIELLIVVSIVGILATLAVPSYRTATIKAKEATLKRDLFVFRDSIDQFRADQGRYPDALDELVQKEYLRSIPVDPFTQSADSWVEEPSPEGTEGGVFDVHSGSDRVGTNDIPYNQW